VLVPKFATIQRSKSVYTWKHLINGGANFLVEQEFISIYCRPSFYLHYDVHGEYESVLFGLICQRWMTTLPSGEPAVGHQLV
jgi:hypothetical protein